MFDKAVSKYDLSHKLNHPFLIILADSKSILGYMIEHLVYKIHIFTTKLIHT
ncbi:hypothetical protein GCM10022396_04270 [Flavivirga amylovorans]